QGALPQSDEALVDEDLHRLHRFFEEDDLALAVGAESADELRPEIGVGQPDDLQADRDEALEVEPLRHLYVEAADGTEQPAKQPALDVRQDVAAELPEPAEHRFEQVPGEAERVLEDHLDDGARLLDDLPDAVAPWA